MVLLGVGAADQHPASELTLPDMWNWPRPQHSLPTKLQCQALAQHLLGALGGSSDDSEACRRRVLDGRCLELRCDRLACHQQLLPYAPEQQLFHSHLL